MQVAVIGSGRWGRALAGKLQEQEKRHRLRVRQYRHARAGEELPIDLAGLADAELMFLAVPAEAARPFLQQAGAVMHGGQFLIHAIGSLEPGTFTRISEIVRQETPVRRVGALAGPALAQDLEEGKPAALICGSRFDEVGAAAAGALSGTSLRVYATRDIVGVELARALAAVVALAGGVARALELGEAARAILITRGAAEMARLGVALGATERTFFGLAGVGELVVATEGRGSADFELGTLLGRGRPLAEAQQQVARTCDGPSMVRQAYRLGQERGLRMTLVTALYHFLNGERSMKEAMAQLFAGEERGE